MLHEGDRVIVGVSGGPDSVCLLFLLHELESELKLDLHAVHVNHMLREEADVSDELLFIISLFPQHMVYMYRMQIKL